MGYLKQAFEWVRQFTIIEIMVSLCFLLIIFSVVFESTSSKERKIAETKEQQGDIRNARIGEQRLLRANYGSHRKIINRYLKNGWKIVHESEDYVVLEKVR